MKATKLQSLLTLVPSSLRSDQQQASRSKKVRELRWKAPEVLAKSSPSIASDIYPLGMCTYEAASLAVRWKGDLDEDIRRSVRRGKLPPRHEAFTDEQWALVEAMCRLNPEERLSITSVLMTLQMLSKLAFNNNSSIDEAEQQSTLSFAAFGGAKGDWLNSATELVKQLLNETSCNLQENEPLCKMLLNDMVRILNAMASQVSKAATRLCESTCSRLSMFCAKHSQSKNVFGALARKRVATEELEKMREMVNHLFTLLDMEHLQENLEKWTELLLVRQEQLKNRLAETRDLADVLPDRVSQVESLTLLRYELALADRVDLRQTDSAELLDRAYKKIVSYCGIEIPIVPSWFIPEYHFDVAADAIGDGSFGVVHQGLLRIKGDTERVVVKYLRIYGLGGVLSSQSFLEDASTWHNLSHKNIIALYGACHVSRRAFLVSEQAEGRNLLEYLRVSENENNIWDRFIEAAQGLEYLHANDIVHGSLRCSSILISKDGTAKLTDFGFRAVRGAVGALAGATPHSQLQ